MTSIATDYSTWTPESLIDRITKLENLLKKQNIRSPSTSARLKKSKPTRPFDPSRYSTRHIALKLAYLGQRYNGFEHHANNTTPLPTIEEELWKALRKAHLIFPTPEDDDDATVNWDGCDYSKCGRTDKGVSAFGQVIGIRVRSNRPLGKQKQAETDTKAEYFDTLPRRNSVEVAAEPLSGYSVPETHDIDLHDPDLEEALSFDPIEDELPYLQILNRLLPEDIRILAWCPYPPSDFSARFSCKERRYRYFFTQPAFAPTPGISRLTSRRIVSAKKPHVSASSESGKQNREGWLNIDAMREAANDFVGVHDFRNFCKVDPSKQLDNFERRIFHADIDEVLLDQAPLNFLRRSAFGATESAADPCNQQAPSSDGSSTCSVSPRIYVFEVHGSAFLWHQIRHMIAILFLVGQGLEPPSLVRELLDTKSVPRRPMYEMATDAPLVLWDCVFPRADDETRKDALEWIYVGDAGGKENGPSRSASAKYGSGGLMDSLWRVWRRRKMDEVLAGSLLDIVASQGREVMNVTFKSQKVFDGGDAPRLMGGYTPVMEKPQLESVEVINNRYMQRKHGESWQDRQGSVWRTVYNESQSEE
ncbi:MAG: hypothetical protein M1833_002710 [Piccolia ochrophora]|nr:MAG: hypothetical protein M1833_002710 [Piccolia ochrophora]